jgi:hypothetical protein
VIALREGHDVFELVDGGGLGRGRGEVGGVGRG